MQADQLKALSRALRIVGGEQGSKHYPWAITTLITQAPQLKGAVCVNLNPGQMTHKMWQPIIAATTALCECGQTRISLPTPNHKPKIELPPKTRTLQDGQSVYLCPIGSDSAGQAYARVTLKDVVATIEWLDTLGVIGGVEATQLGIDTRDLVQYPIAFLWGESAVIPLALLTSNQGSIEITHDAMVAAVPSGFAELGVHTCKPKKKR